jgi:O-antigen ligase
MPEPLSTKPAAAPADATTPTSAAPTATRLLPPLACMAVAGPALLAVNVSPSATFLNQAVAFFGWGLLVATLAWALRGSAVGGGAALHRPWHAGLGGAWPAARNSLSGGAGALALALLLLIAAALLPPLRSGQPWALASSVAGSLAAALVVAWAGAAARGAGLLRPAFGALCIGLVAAGVASSLVGLVQVFAPQWADGQWIAGSSIEGRAVGNLRQPNHLASLLLWGIVAVVWLADQRRLRRPVAAALALLMMFVVVLTASRTGMLGAVMLALWGLLDRRLSRPARVLLVAMPLVYAAGWWGMNWWAQVAQHAFAGDGRLRTGSDISSSRFGIWTNTLSLIAMRPWAGVGVGEFNLAWTLTPFPGRPIAFFDHTHNLPLQLAVELGLPLALLVMGLLCRALWCAWRATRTPAGPLAEAALAETSALRAALVLVLMMAVHSLLEYPLWYAYFLLPTAFALGLGAARGPGQAAASAAVAVAVDAAPPAATTAPAAGTGSRALLLAGLLLTAGAAAAVIDYRSVSIIFEPPANAAPLPERIAAGQRSWFFSHHADYAAATTAERPSEAMAAFAGASHYLLDARLMQAWARGFGEAGDVDRARHLAQRLKEFRHADAASFFAPCAAARSPAAAPASAPAEALPFQCESPARVFSYEDFR